MSTDNRKSVSPASPRRKIPELKIPSSPVRIYLPLALLAVAALVNPWQVAAQGGYAIWGEVKIDSGNTDKSRGVMIILYRSGFTEVGRQSVSSGGRYRFTNLGAAEYDIVVEAEDKEIARARLSILSGVLSPFYGFRQDFEFAWKSNSTVANSNAPVISAADVYSRSQVNQSLFQKAQDAVEKKSYEKGVVLLKQVLDADKLDFQVWTLLGTVYKVQENAADAEKAYLSAIQLKPAFSLALLNLGRLRSSQKRFAEAIEPLTGAVTAQPQSGEANLLLGEAYIQIKKGSKAIEYLNEAARLGQPDAHLRLGWLYNAAGMKDKAAAEYKQFLEKKPDYPDRKKMQEYISANKKG